MANPQHGRPAETYPAALQQPPDVDHMGDLHSATNAFLHNDDGQGDVCSPSHFLESSCFLSPMGSQPRSSVSSQSVVSCHEAFHEDVTLPPPPLSSSQPPTPQPKDHVHDPYFLDGDYEDEDEELPADADFEKNGIPPLPEVPTGPPQLPPQAVKVTAKAKLIDPDRLFSQQMMEKVSSVFERQMLKLIIKLDKFGAPLYAFQEIIKWIEESIHLKLLARGEQSDDMKSMKRSTFIKRLRARFPDVKAPSSTQVALEDTITTPFLSGLQALNSGCCLSSSDQLAEDFSRVPRGTTSCVPHFDAKDQIMSLLKDIDLFGDPSQLYVNVTKDPDDLFWPFRHNSQEPIDGLMSGSWYQQMTKSKSFDQNREFVIPLVGYIDATGTDAYSRFRLEPFLITFGLFRPTTFAKANAWRVMGLVPDIDLDSTAKKQKKRSHPNGGKSMYCRNYHKQLRAMLASLVKLQATGLEYELQIGGYKKKVRLTFPMAFIMGDQKSNNNLAGRLASHSQTVERCSRACFVSFKELTDTKKKCYKVPQELYYQLTQHLFNLAKSSEEQDDGSMAPIIPAPLSTTPCISSPQDESSEGEESGTLLLRQECPGERGEEGDDASSSTTSSTVDASAICDPVPTDVDQEAQCGSACVLHDDNTSRSSAVSSRSSGTFSHVYSEDKTFLTSYMAVNKKRTELLAKKLAPTATDEDRKKRKDALAASRFEIYDLCRNKVQTILGADDLNSLTAHQWKKKRCRLWVWINALSVEQTRGIMAIFAQYEVRLATHEIWFGCDRYGINLCTPTDLMHAFLLGVVRYAMESMFKKWPTSFRAEIDDLVDKTIRSQNQNERRNFPRADFSKGITNLTQLTAQEWAGLSFTVYLVLLTRPGAASYLTNVAKKGSRGVSDKAAQDMLNKEIVCLAQMQTFMAYYKYGTYWRPNNTRAQHDCLQSIQILSQSLQSQLPRDEGLGWNVPKLHELTHTPLDIERYGSPSGFDASTGERLLKYLAKIPSENVQKQTNDDFNRQLCCRLHEATLIHRAEAAWLTDEGEGVCSSINPIAIEKEQCRKFLLRSGSGARDRNTFVCTVSSFMAELNIGILTAEASGIGHGAPSGPDARYAVNKCRSTEAQSKDQIPRIHPVVLTEVYRKIACLVCDAYHNGPTASGRRVEHSKEVVEGEYDCIVKVTVNGYSEGYINRPNDYGVPTMGDNSSVLSQDECFRVRCIPSYRGTRPWYDWIECMPSETTQEAAPDQYVVGTVCKIFSLFNFTTVFPSGLDQMDVGDGETLAVVWQLIDESRETEVLVDRMVRRHLLAVHDDGEPIPGGSAPLLNVININQAARRRIMVVEDYPRLQELYEADKGLAPADVHYVSVVLPMKHCWAQAFTEDVTVPPSEATVEVERQRQETIVNSWRAKQRVACSSINGTAVTGGDVIPVDASEIVVAFSTRVAVDADSAETDDSDSETSVSLLGTAVHPAVDAHSGFDNDSNSEASVALLADPFNNRQTGKTGAAMARRDDDRRCRGSSASTAPPRRCPRK